ncbi:hydrogenase maturation protease [Kribbella ginsengisoli]|uniref:Hydrogenase maturation protease n=1 Tax=Kribbella ginsengisoli TaxID=363865 RepID=A0ABP6VZ05_9ACTN
MTRAVVIGVGNEYRRDDGIGPALIAALEDRWLPGVSLIRSDGEPVRLIEDWAGASLAVVVDAVLCEPSSPGEIHQTEVCLQQPDGAKAPGTHSAGSHSLGIPDALRLARALDRLPHRLIVYAVEAADTSLGTELSAPVAAALPRLTEAVVQVLRK